MSPSESSPSTDPSEDETDASPKRDFAQLMGGAVIATGLGLVVLGSIGVVTINVATIRVLIFGGGALILGWKISVSP